MKKKLFSVIIIGLLFLSGCGGSGSDSSVMSGTFIDDPVEGLVYFCSSGTWGETKSDGEFSCLSGDDVTFYLNAKAIGTVPATNSMITPFSLFPDDPPSALNLARLLQSIDLDSNPDPTTIVIDDSLVALLPDDLDFSSSTLIFAETVEAALGITLVTLEQAQQQLTESIASFSELYPPGSSVPVADAGPDQNVSTGSTVILNGSGSTDSDGDALIYSWGLLKPVGSSAVLVNPASISPTFVPDFAGEYTITLIVFDGSVSNSDSVTITATTGAGLPAAPQGLQATAGDAEVTLSWTAVSDATGYMVYWNTTGSVDTSDNLFGPIGITLISLSELTNGTTYYYRVAALNSFGESSLSNEASAMPLAGADNSAPQNATTANFIAGGAVSTSTATVLLSLDATDNIGVSAYFATEDATPPAATAAGWTAVALATNYSADVSFELSGGDGVKTVFVWFQDEAGNRSASVSDTITLNTASGNMAPVADAGLDQNITLGTGEVVLNGSGSSDADDDPLDYFWEFLLEPLGSTAVLSGASTITAEFTPNVSGTYRVQLNVSDATDSSADVVDVIVTEPVGGLPTADAGEDQEVARGSWIMLDGSLSSDPNGTELTYTWTQIPTTCADVTEGVGTLSGVDPSFRAPSEVCTLIFDLRVDNGTDTSSTDRIQLYVLEQAGTAIFVDAINGDDANPGTRAAPKKTIEAGRAELWNVIDPTDVYVAQGLYPEHVSWTGGMSLYGGFSAGWVRDPGVYVSEIEAEGTVIDCGYMRNCSGATIDGFTITSISPTTQTSAEAILVSASTQSSWVVITNNIIVVHAAPDGPDAVASTAPNNPGWTGLPGNPGGDGGDGSCDGSVFGSEGVGGQGLHMGLDGGNGGAGGWTSYPGGLPGDNGDETVWPDQNGGLGGVAGGSIGSSGADGSPGSNGTNADDGAPASQLGLFNSYGYSPSRGDTGGTGHAGAGGGGGGGGAVNNGVSNGSGGGGGGEGGEAGYGCWGASSGMGAFGIYIWGPTAATIRGNIITVGSGGSGGSGCPGGLGGAGGAGGAGGSLVCTDPTGAGGNGGQGGKGADGGAGGDGAGGPSIGIAYVGQGVTVNSDLTTSNTISVADPAPGGPSNGVEGLSVDIYTE